MEQEPENEFDKSILQLIEQIKTRREQAVQFAQQVERSIHQTDTAGFIGQDINSAGILNNSVSETSSHSGSPPESFLEGFTCNFIDTYKAPIRPKTDALSGRKWQSDRGVRDMHGAQQLNEIEGALQAHVHSDSSSASQPHTAEEETDSGSSDYDAAIEHIESGRPGSPQAEPSRGITAIDREARAQMWQRANASASKGDEARIQNILKMAERISRMASPKSSPDIAASEQQHIQTPPPLYKDAVEQWGPKEWERWADFVRTTSSMRDHLEWVHNQQQNAWQHGFTDAWLANGKLQRTYRGLGLTLQAYPDGNVKRTAITERGTKTCTTLYFANGDWSCVVETDKGKASYYYYCDERVWHEQTSLRNAYRYPDGREEHVDNQGAVTVRYPSGSVRVTLGSCNS
ncbi:hypothetical protein IWW36_004738 [Coemansia brasiliensis]|uniref:Centromere protein J C-terminal domain-containing protein n=1 Tax=Coemansia brasiliensis TaxID=2650707 RepID=A0A9W8LYH7_9FUNG|nr:hypothetical protein IWW36_004738 [Coemansia brasiliensis]